MKEYPLTFNELISLGGLGLISGALASLGTFFLSTWWQLSQAFAFSPPPSAITAARWHGIQDVSLVVALAFYAATALLIVVGGATAINIWRETEHD